MPIYAYIFCALVDLAAIAAIVWLGWFIWQGASGWLILAMPLLFLMTVIPANGHYTCPKCGHISIAKSFMFKDQKPIPLTDEHLPDADKAEAGKPEESKQAGGE